MLMVPIFGFWHKEWFFFFLYILVIPKISTMIICDFKKKSIYILKGNLPSTLDQIGKFQLQQLFAKDFHQIM